MPRQVRVSQAIGFAVVGLGEEAPQYLGVAVGSPVVGENFHDAGESVGLMAVCNKRLAVLV